MVRVLQLCFIAAVVAMAWSVAAKAQDRVCFTRPDGGMSTISPAPGVSLEQAMANVPAGMIDVAPCDSAAFPDREFRDAWRNNAGTVSVDLPAARDIQAERIEAARRLKAKELVEREMLGEDVAAEKAALRASNARQLVDGAQNVDALKNVWPPGLDRP